MVYLYTREMSGHNLYQSDDIYYFNAHRPTELILRLQQRYDEFNSIKEKVIPEIFARHGYTVKEIHTKEGNFWTWHVIYFVTTTDDHRYVYRANVGLNEPEYYMWLEKDFITLAEKVHFPTGKVIVADSSRQYYDFDYQILELLPGLEVRTERDGSKEQYDSISYQLGHYAALEYQMPVQWWGRFIAWSAHLQGAKQTAFDYLTTFLDYDLDFMNREEILSPEASQIIREHFDWSKNMINKQQQSYLVHHDLVDNNTRYDKESYKILAIYDRENAVAFDPISELGSVATRKSHYPRAEIMRQWFLDTLGYTPDDFDAKIALYFLRTILWKIPLAIKSQKLTDRHKQLMNTALAHNNLSIDRAYNDLGTIIV